MRSLLTAVAVLVATSIAAAQDAEMQHGAHLMTTFEGGGLTGTTNKGLVVRLGQRAAVAFDTELLRLSAAWTNGWLRLRGTAYDGAHGPMPKLRGHKIAETRPGPGWAKDGKFEDPRPIPFGPLPREWGQFRGMWLHGDQVVIGYRVGDMNVREAWSALGLAGLPVRTLELGPSSVAQTMVVLDGPDGAAAGIASVGDLQRMAMLQWQPQVADLVELALSTRDWDALAMGGPARADYLDAASGTGATISYVPGFARPHGSKPTDDADAKARQLSKLADGEAAASADDWAHSVWFDKHKVDDKETDDGRLLVDLQKVVDVTRVNTFTWHAGYRSTQQYELFGSTAEQAPNATAADLAAAGWQHLAKVDSGTLGEGDKHGVGISKAGGLGKWRHLLFKVSSGSAFFSEIDVFADRFRAGVDAVGRSRQNLVCALHGAPGAELVVEGTRMLMRVPAHQATVQLQLTYAAGDESAVQAALPALIREVAIAPLPQKPAAARWGAPLVTKGELGGDDGAFATDTITIPFDNPFHSRMRTAAFDFFRDGRAAVSTWNGDVWIVSGIDADLDRLEWKRYATGLFDPLGLRIVDDVVYVHGRDGITRLRDENGDGEADFYECFNNQVYITAGFHEFAFDLQTDAAGNFYFSKGAPVNPGGRGFMKIVPHHGTILKVSKDGSSIETVATGLRAPNGIGVSPTGVITSGDNEGRSEERRVGKECCR